MNPPSKTVGGCMGTFSPSHGYHAVGVSHIHLYWYRLACRFNRSARIVSWEIIADNNLRSFGNLLQQANGTAQWSFNPRNVLYFVISEDRDVFYHSLNHESRNSIVGEFVAC